MLKFATVVIYTDDVRVLPPRDRAGATYYDEEIGFAQLGEDQAVAIASHEAGMLMIADGYIQARSERVRGTELAQSE